MSYSAGELGVNRGVLKPLVAPDHGVLLPLAAGLTVAVKETKNCRCLRQSHRKESSCEK